MLHYAMIQYSIKAGIKIFPEKWLESVSDEFKQLHDKETFQSKPEKYTL